jgi:hypothetical protein
MTQQTRNRLGAYLNIFLKLVLGGLIVHALWFNELTQYRQKAFGIRIVSYPIIALLSYGVYRFFLRKRNVSYPLIIDLCLTAVVVADFAGNTLNLYDSIAWWDDAMHFLISIPWVIAGGLSLAKLAHRRAAAFLLVLGYGAVSHILWEIFEYFSFVRSNSTEFATAYQDTILDLILSLSGSLTGALIFCIFLYQRNKKRGTA